MNERQFNFGDLVRVAGYDDRIFSVDGWRVEHYYYPDEEWTDVVYELTDVHSAEWLEADEEDLTLVTTADKAEDYLAQHKPSQKLTAKISPMFFIGVDLARSPKVSPEIERYNKARERERKVNELLDKRNDLRTLYEMFGDDQYKKRIEEIDKELRSVE